MIQAARLAFCLCLVCFYTCAQPPSSQELQYLSSVLPLIQANSWVDAQAKLQDGLALYPHSAVLMNALGMVYEREDKKPEAIKSYRQAIEWLPGFVAAQLHLGSVLVSGGNCEEAIPQFQAVTQEANDTGALSAAGLELAQCKSYTEAVTALEKAHSINPQSDTITFNLALAQYQNHAWTPALDSLNQITAAETVNAPEALFLRGKLMLELKLPGATDYMGKACRARPAEDFCNDAAIALMRAERFLEAEELLESSFPTLANSASVQSTLGIAQFRLGRYQDAISSYTKAMDLDPGLTAAREGLAFLLYMTGDLEQARAVIEKGLRSPNADFYLHYLHALVLYRQGRSEWKRALSSLETAIGLQNDFAPAYFLSGKIRMEQGDSSGALRDFETAVQNDPKYALPYYKMAQVYLRLGRNQEAESARQRFAELGSRREEEVLAAQAQKQLISGH